MRYKESHGLKLAMSGQGVVSRGPMRLDLSPVFVFVCVETAVVFLHFVVVSILRSLCFVPLSACLVFFDSCFCANILLG